MRNHFFVAICVLLIPHTIAPITTISFFIRPLRDEKILTSEKIRETIQEPGKIVYKALKNSLDNKTNEGILSSYWGYLAVSDFMGRIWFPRHQANEKLKILITERILPILMIGNTIHHWEIDPTTPATLYTIERVQDKSDKKFYWQVQEGNLPANNRIQLDTILIFAKPKDVVIPTGPFLTTDNPQLVLPDVFAKKTLNRISPALWILKMRQFFGPIKTTIKKISDTYYSEQLLP